jgi:adenylate cyclase
MLWHKHADRCWQWAQTMQRKLAAILVADFVGSTSAMEADEERTVTRVADCLKTIGDIVSRHEGRIFSTAGDAVLAEFSSPVNALRAAMEARGAIASMPETSAQDMRFGLHLADVVVLGGDLRGDGVNVAARLQAGAEPGDIHVSGALYDHVRRVSPCVFDQLGEKHFKGVSEPILVYRVGHAVDRYRFQSAPTRSAPPTKVRPNSVAVTPFTPASPMDEDQSFLAEGLTDDLTLELGRLKSLFESSRSASTALATKDPVEIGKALGVRYVIGGTVRKLGTNVRLNISLVETDQGRVVWSDRVQRPFAELLDVLDEVTARVSATVSGRIEQAELAVARLKRPENMGAYEFYLMGLEHHRLGGVNDNHYRDAVRWFEKAMNADPNFGRPFAMHVCAWSSLPDFDLTRAESQVAHALDLDPTDPEAHRIMGAIKLKNREFAASRHHHERAIELAPNEAYTIGRCAAFYLFTGQPEKALSLLDRAEALDPFLPVWITEERIASLYVLGRFEEMLSVACGLPLQTRRILIYRTAAYVALGDIRRARDMVRQALAMDPTLTGNYILMQELFEDETITETLTAHARTAGLPEVPVESKSAA